MGTGPAWAERVALSLLGVSKSPLLPDVLHLGFVDATDTEPAGLARVPVSALGDAWGGDGTGAATTIVIDVGAAPAGLPELVAWVLCDAATGGDVVLTGSLDAPLTPVTGAPLTVPVGGLKVRVT